MEKFKWLLISSMDFGKRKNYDMINRAVLALCLSAVCEYNAIDGQNPPSCKSPNTFLSFFVFSPSK